jgi:hypothetical protein
MNIIENGGWTERMANTKPNSNGIIHFIVNRKPYDLRVGIDINQSDTLAETLRETLGVVNQRKLRLGQP